VRLLIAAVVVMFAALASRAGAGLSAAPNPCKLVTAADVNAALGPATGRGKLQTLGLYTSCTYATKRGATVTVQTRPLSRTDFVKSAKANPPPVKAVGGLGAPAYFAGGYTLLVWRGGNEATFSVFGGGPALAPEVKLAKRALPRL
jgi:hypothetical protein